MKAHYGADDLDEMAGEKVRFTGSDGVEHELTRYEGEQKLRGIERKIRYYKKKALVRRSAGVDDTAARRKLGEWQTVARDFTRQTGLRRDYAREYVGVSRSLWNPMGEQPRGKRENVQSSANNTVVFAPEQNRFPKGDPIRASAENMKKDGSYYDFAAHGTPSKIQINGKMLNAEEIAQIIKKDPRFSTENGVRLISCSTGQGKDCIAQQLANILQCEVKAPNDEIRVRPDGSYYIGYFGLGNWQIFTPKE